jgi:integrase
MGHVTRTRAGTWRANWRSPTGRQRAKTFPTRRDASRFLAEVEAAKTRGLYIDPHAGRLRFAVFARRWEASRVVEATTAASTRSKLRARLVPYWGDWPVNKIDHLAVQEWINQLSRELTPSSVASYLGTFSTVMKSAVRARIVAVNPAEGVQLPARRKSVKDERMITLDDLVNKLLPAIPDAYRALPATAAGAGLRWGECLGLRWADVNLDDQVLAVQRVLVEVRGQVAIKPYPKSKAGRRTVPLAPFLLDALTEHRELTRAVATDQVFTGPDGGHLLRGNFRRRIWRPALVRAGLLGRVVVLDHDGYRACWQDEDREEQCAEFSTDREAVANIVDHAHGGLRFHDLRHCYATWLVSRGLPVNAVQHVMGHEQPSTTLNLYTHAPTDYYDTIRRALATPADYLLTFEINNDAENATPHDQNRVDQGR